MDNVLHPLGALFYKIFLKEQSGYSKELNTYLLKG